MKVRTQLDQADLFAHFWKLLAPEVGEPVREYVFAPPRKFRFDFAWVNSKVSVEVDGGQWSKGGGRHNRDDDREKLNLAAERGWIVFRFSPEMIRDDPHKCIFMVSNRVWDSRPLQ